MKDTSGETIKEAKDRRDFMCSEQTNSNISMNEDSQKDTL